MIIIDIEDYCQGCPDFEANVFKQVLYSDDIYTNTRQKMCDAQITCKYADRCRGIYAFLKEKAEKNEKNKW